MKRKETEINANADPNSRPGSIPARPLSAKVEWLLSRAIFVIGGVISIWLLLAYVILPVAWRHYEHHPVMENAPKTTLTSLGIVGDPLNVGLFGTESEVVGALLAAGWSPADPVTLRSSLRIAESVVLKREYTDAPVSSLFVFGRKQDLAFEKPVGGNASHRHHVRFWKSNDLGRDGVPLWIGAATYDRSVGLSHRTGQITHHIAADVDAERDGLISDLVRTKRIKELFQVTGVGATMTGRNGGGDWYYTDGELTLGVIVSPGASADAGSVEPLANPQVVRIKDQLWNAFQPVLDRLNSD